MDCETHRIAPGLLAPPLVCVSLAWTGDAPAWVPAAGPDVVREDGGPLDVYTGRALLGREATLPVLPYLLAEDHILGANLAFDLVVLAAAAPACLPLVFAAAREGRLSDVQVRERLIANAAGTLDHARVALAALAARYLGVDRSTVKGPDAWRTRYGELDGVLLEDWDLEAVVYPLDDASDTLGVHVAQSAGPRLVDGYPLRVEGDDGFVSIVSEDRESRAALALHMMATYGLRTDPVAVAALVAEWTETAARGKAAGVEGGWIRGPGTKPASKVGTLDKKRLQAIVTEVLGDDTPRTAPTATFPAGQVQYGEDVLLLAADRPGAPATLRTYAEALTATSWLTKWGPPLEAGTRAPLTYRTTHLVATGRCSISEPPLQQPPRKGGVRECFVPRDGFVFCSVDYHIAELCALAQLHIWLRLGDTMARAINAGRDLHLVTAAAIATAEGTPTTYDEMRAAYKAGDPLAKHRRQLAKVANFGFPGGLGASRFVEYAASQGVTVTAEAAATLRNAWLAAWPEMRGYFAMISRNLEYRDAFTVQHPISGRLRGGVRYTDGCNGLFQGAVGDISKAAAWTLVEATYLGTGHPRARDLYGSRIILHLHDELLAELPIDRAHEAAEAMAAIMVDVARSHCPDLVWRAEPALCKRWYKAAETVRDAYGRLVPWQPAP